VRSNTFLSPPISSLRLLRDRLPSWTLFFSFRTGSPVVWRSCGDFFWDMWGFPAGVAHPQIHMRPVCRGSNWPSRLTVLLFPPPWPPPFCHTLFTYILLSSWGMLNVSSSHALGECFAFLAFWRPASPLWVLDRCLYVPCFVLYR